MERDKGFVCSWGGFSFLGSVKGPGDVLLSEGCMT